METNADYDAATALRDAQQVRDQVAERAAAPGYYYPILGLASALLVAGQAAGGSFSVLGLLAAMALCLTLSSRYRAETGLWTVYGTTGARAFTLWAGLGAAIVGLLAVALYVQVEGHSAWWAPALGLAAFAVTMVGGRVIDSRLRADIRRGVTAPSCTR